MPARDRPLFGLVLKNNTNPAYGGAIWGATATAAKLGAMVSVRAPAIPDDVGQQIAIIEAMIVERPDAIILLPAHHTELAPTIEAVHRANIPLVLVVNRPEGARALTLVTSDDYDMAFRVGRTLAGTLRPGKVAIVEGHPNAIGTLARRRGFEAAIAEQPGLELVARRSGLYQKAPAKEAAAAILRDEPDVTGFFVANDLMAMGVLEALDELGHRASLVSINGTPEAVAEVKRGRLLATALFNTLKFGALAAEAAKRHLDGEAIPAEIVLAAPIIDAANLRDWDRPYEERGLPVWADELLASARGR